jgi:hypothetical protein
MLGAKVCSIVSGETQSGVYSTPIPVELLPSGAYFIRMTAGPFTETKKFNIDK